MTINTSTITDTGEYSLLIFAELGDSANYTPATNAEVAITIWLVDLVPAAQNEMFYIIGDTVKVSDAIEVFNYTPVSAGTYTITYTLSIPIGTPTVSSLAVSGGNIDVGPETDISIFGSHSARLTGTLNDTPTTSDFADFTLNLIKLVGTLADQTYRILSTGTAKSVAFSAVTQDPSGGTIPTYTYTYTLIGWDGTTESTANSAIFNKGAGNTVEIATADTSAA